MTHEFYGDDLRNSASTASSPTTHSLTDAKKQLGASASAMCVAVVGSGIAGLSAALAIASRGLRVTLLESSERVGGKMRTVHVDGREVDSGPTVLTMPWVFEELFAGAGLELAAYVTFEKANVLARHYWPDGSTLDLFANRAESIAAIAAFAGAAAADEYARYAEYAAQIWQTAEQPFIRSQRPTYMSMLREAARLGISGLSAIDAHRTVWKSVCAHFSDPRLRQLFGRYATYTGSSPFAAPATLNIIAHVEQLGVHTVRGGMIELAKALARACADLGVDIQLNANVDDILTPKGERPRLCSADTETAYDAIVWAGDVAALAALDKEQTILSNYKFAHKERSLSAVTYSGLAIPTGVNLATHNVFFSSDYAAEFDSIFKQSKIPQDPTVYICAQDRAGSASVPVGRERLFCIVNAPARGESSFSAVELESCDASFYSRLSTSGLNLQQVELVRTTPAGFHALFPHTGGALYGLAAHGAMAPLKRPGARTLHPQIYLASGSIHPGAGVPMAAMSGRLAAESLCTEFSSIRLS
jgi:1-hydroxycarotenoid 3,4-desaturase